MTRPKIYDCFCYFNEDMLLELRLETLWDHVDYFVISEAVYTQTGNPKPLNFDIEKFAKYRDKIRYLVVDHFAPGARSAWKNENYQRNYLIHGLHDAQPDDWILVSDLDEIPYPSTIRAYDPRYRRGDFQQHAYAYFLNNQLVQDDGRPAIWAGSKITTMRQVERFFGNINAVRSYKSSGPLRSLRRAWFRRFEVQRLTPGGWHFTWVLSPEKILLKMESIADQAFVRDEHKDLAYIDAQIHSGRDLLNPNSRYVAQTPDSESFPPHLAAHRERYAQWLRPV
ncbi:beta-1,4-mannosyl-glycoprotein beta-1,4-N-acetylglucosaminyltransferase [Burkholderia ubonensis]|uniref:beta-1,4-mannosyl-glycoprotein beta-1,4-N-acetylglucosaminyltransferase n=1 Tax=Burkholderia ubonensis TaxID=101571 RepID=UPI000752EC5D|nr:beta-1,4-mannosyl-glycoprotein beta-1,4-N-acetylglucosaminyltransferase [Burkholderia ubonensis]AOI71085.1 beta-1,4-mannosyl-glycoprotein beta-1,4-N-acetylglucosaminyltransferase [Burkholderia ubonensis]KUZ20187.1 beta-1,4-mannosyl-glycoprotein beta-1,4-N-acetylglucosaminyltransferase [Burkholderia ubonensis]KUZ24923.1 beta-1,4-mannosyl-glycoprotein beta-1,4-N-acetylglucosaminyltransferase [Burkholderia ubonensis]KUZ27439.1 beta-1,4-mannosyl-glycoprotein beta-1,4-N-acetylglucosaminyltransfer